MASASEPEVAELEGALRDPNDAARRNAARSAFARRAAPEAADRDRVRSHLEELAARDPDEDVRLLAATALGESGNSDAVPALCGILHDAPTNVAAAAADALGVLGDARAAEPLARLARSSDPWLRAAAVSALGDLRAPEAINALARATLAADTAEVATRSLGAIAHGDALTALRAVVEGRNESLRTVAGNAAARILGTCPEVTPPAWLRRALEGQETELAARISADADDPAARLLGAAGTTEAAQLLVDLLEDDHTRAAAIAGLALVPDRISAPVILQRLERAEGEQAELLAMLAPAADGGPEDSRKPIDEAGT